MSFDAETNLPILQPKKKTTQVNIWMAVFVALFFVAMAVAIFRLAERNPNDANHRQPAGTERR